MRHSKLSICVRTGVSILVAATLMLNVGGCSLVDGHNKTESLKQADVVIPQAAQAQGIMQVADHTLEYTVHWIPLELTNDQGQVNAYISGTAYIKTEDTNAGFDSNRPVIFFFNGGPGASSSPMHNKLGPQGNIDQRAHIFEYADMVFVDPVGTGFSRNLSEQTPYWSREGDARAAVQYLKFWRQHFDRKASDFYMAGASYGSFRLAMMLPELTEMGISGGIFVSPSLDFSGNAETASNNRSFVHRLPTKAVAAWYHGVANQDLDNVIEVYTRARRFAEDEYLKALYKGNLIKEEEASNIAHTIANLTGLSENYILEHNLRIPTQDFLENLLPNHLLGRLDVRVAQTKTQPAANENRPPAANDPSLGLGASNKLVSKVLGDYYRGTVGVDTELDYYSINLDLNFAWEWRAEQNSPRFVVNPLDRVIEAMEINPEFKLLVLGGYFDLTTPVSGQEYTFSRFGIDPARTEFVFVPAPHAPFDADEYREILIHKIQAFVERRPVTHE